MSKSAKEVVILGGRGYSKVVIFIMEQRKM